MRDPYGAVNAIARSFPSSHGRIRERSPRLRALRGVGGKI